MEVEYNNDRLLKINVSRTVSAMWLETKLQDVTIPRDVAFLIHFAKTEANS